jgi:lysophospholipase L1-like esterase
MLYQRLRNRGIDVVVRHLIAHAIGAPAERKLGKISSAHNQGTIAVGEPKQIIGPQSGLNVLEGDIIDRLAAREAADEMGARLVPADVAFQQEWQKHPGHTGLLLTDDGAHLNAAGHRLVADASLKAWKMA